MKPYKKESSFSYAIGVYPTLELISSRPNQITQIFLSSKGNPNQGVKKIIEFCQSKRIPFEIADRVIEKISQSENNYAVATFNKYTSPLNTNNHLCLINPSDKGNLGTIIRTMLGFSINNISLIKPAVDIFDPKVIRASMGSVFRINFSYFDNFQSYQNLYHYHYYPFLVGADLTLSKVKFQPPYCLIFGNEGAGLEDNFIKVGQPISIPQSSQIDSLNLSVAAGIALHHSYTNR